MYPVSPQYLEKITGYSVRTNWYGSILTANGNVYSFDPTTIIEGSGTITREICPREDIDIGTTCSAELDISLVLPEEVNRYELYEGTVSLFFQLELSEGEWETVPIGIFTISEPPERTQNVVTIHGYDAMLKFNKTFGLSLVGTPYYLLNYACNVCGVELGTTQEQIEHYTNGLTETYTYSELEIYTYRDFIGYVASYLCCFAYIGADGKLYISPYTNTVTRTVSPNWRFSYTPQDYEAFYTAIAAFCASAEKSEVVALSSDGLTYEMGTNPLIQFNDENTRITVLTNIITQLSTVSYTPFTATVPCDPALMPGDVLNFVGNHAVDGKLSAITKQVIKINGSMELSCAGSDPNLNVLTATEKQIQTATRNSNKDGMYYYDYANTTTVTIRDGETVRIIALEYLTSKDTHVDFHAEVKAVVETTEAYDETEDIYSETDGVITVTYTIGGVVIQDYHPVDTFTDGVRLLHLLYTWWATANRLERFEVTLKCTGCKIRIPIGAIHAYIAGTGLVGDEADSTLSFDDGIPLITFNIVNEFYDGVEVELLEEGT